MCEGARGFQHGGMLNRRNHEMHGICRFSELPEHRVVALAAAAGEAQTLGRHPDLRSDATTSVLQHSPCFASGAMRTGRVALTTGRHRLQSLPNFREQRRSCVVVKISQLGLLSGGTRCPVGQRCDRDTALRPHRDLRLLPDFAATDEWVLEPGDILYVPPGFAHEGVAVGDDCMTYSIGFRAPSRPDMLVEWADHLAAQMPDDDLYADPDIQSAASPGEIEPDAIARLHAMTIAAMADRSAFAAWFGQHVTTPKYADADWRQEDPVTAEELLALIDEGAQLWRNPASRFAFLREEDGVTLFVDGSAHPCAGDLAILAQQLCAHPTLALDPSMVAGVGLLVTLVNQGSLMIDDGQED